jgi:hypothetical protein
MKKINSYLLFLLLIFLLLVSGNACHLLLPYELKTESTEDNYFCSAQIYRGVSSTEEFTEEWQCYTTALSYDAAISNCTQKIKNYIKEYMAPGFSWDYRNLTSVVSNSKEKAADCAWTIDGLAIFPPTYGAPFGSELRWNFPPADQANAFISFLDKDGVYRTAEPNVANAYVDFAEKTGMPDEGTYEIGKRHIRFSDLYLELDTPFDLGDMSVKRFYIQSIGTIIAEGGEGVSYQVKPYNSKFFMYAQGEQKGETGTTSFCFTNGFLYGFNVYQGAPHPYFTFSINLEVEITSGQYMTLQVSLSKPQAPYSFNTHQPYVMLIDKETTEPQVDLEAHILWDTDNNLDENAHLWFENFETTNEIFLGKGNPLRNVPFSVGEHEITFVAYDVYGAYNNDSMVLKISNAKPMAKDDYYEVKEDSILIIYPPGVLSNDTDANDDALTAIKVSDPSAGTLSLGLDGSFTYEPIPNYFGTDSFTYKADDGTDYSDIATVTVTVIEIPPEQEAKDWRDSIPPMVNDGTLNEGQGNSLIVKIDQVIIYLNAGKVKQACNLLNAIINQVESFINEGVLTLGQGQPLIDKANNLSMELGC